MRANRAGGSRNLVLDRREGRFSVKPSVDQQAEKPRPALFHNIDAIASGVEAWFEENTGYSRKVTETTADIARVLGVPKSEIKRWAAARSGQNTEKSRVVQSLLVRLQGSFPGADSGEP